MPNRFADFVLNTWIRYEKYSGISRVSAIFLNCLLCVLKLLACILIMVFLSPHLGAQALRNRKELGLFGTIVYILLVVISLIFDLPFLCLLIALVATAWYALTSWTLIGLLSALLCGSASYWLLRLLWVLVYAVLFKAETQTDNEVNNGCDGIEENGEMIMNNDEKMIAAVQEIVDAFGPGNYEISTHELKVLMHDKYDITEGSVLPADYCYNRVNDGINPAKKPMLFEYLEPGHYRCWGQDYPFDGPVKHIDQIVGKCEKGERRLFAEQSEM